MENVHAERSAGWSALCFVAVLLIATFITSPLAPPTYDPAHLALLIDLNRSHLLLGAWLSFPAAAFFLWFLVGLRTYLAHAPGRPEGLPTFAFVAGIVMATQALLAACFETAVVFVRPEVFQANGMAGVYGAFIFTQEGLGYAPVAIFLFAAAHSMRRHHSAPPWLAWLGYLAALGCAYSTLSIFYADPSNLMSPVGPGPGLFGALPAAVWIVATGVVLIRTREPAAEPSTAASAALDTPSEG
jgi:hypothetical protein